MTVDELIESVRQRDALNSQITQAIQHKSYGTYLGSDGTLLEITYGDLGRRAASIFVPRRELIDAG